MDRAAICKRLAEELPMTGASSLEDEARSVLRYLLESKPPKETRTTVLGLACPNCGSALPTPRSPYCSDACREAAAFVRQFRASCENGSIFEPERQVALGQKLWYLAGGGRPWRFSLIPPRAIAQVIARQEGRCQGCGAPATKVDHYLKSG